MTKAAFSAYQSLIANNSVKSLGEQLYKLDLSCKNEAVASDSSQLLNSVNNAKTLLHYFDRYQSNLPDLPRLSLDSKDQPEVGMWWIQDIGPISGH